MPLWHTKGVAASKVESTAMTRAPAGVVLLAAGRGSRLLPLTAHTHKSLLPVAGQPVLQYAIDEVLGHGVGDVVVVTGDKRESVDRFVRSRYGARVTLVGNDRYEADTNILSAEIGVGALRHPTEGYLILETDLVVEPAGWRSILDVGDGDSSYWVTRGSYGETLTGGALRADDSGRVTGLVYAPVYDRAFEGWQKLVGALYVGRGQVAMDRELRQRGIGDSIAQYYMAPWVRHLALLPCSARALGGLFAESFNDLEAYRATERRFSEVSARETP